MTEQFALVSGSESDTTRKRRIELAVNNYLVTIVAIKVTYELIEDSFEHIHYSSDGNRTVLKTLYKDRAGEIYYKGAGQYSNHKTKAKNPGKTYLTHSQLEDLYDYIDRYSKRRRACR